MIFTLVYIYLYIYISFLIINNMCFNMAQELVWEYQVKTKKKTTEKKQQLIKSN